MRSRLPSSLEAALMRMRDCSLRDGSSENQSTVAPGSGSKSNSSDPKKRASMTAAAITVLPAPVVAAKAIKNFAKDNKALVIKGGYMDGKPLSVAEIETIADLETREVLLAKLAGAMKGNLAKAAGLFNQPASQVARLAAALQEKKNEAGETE